SNYNFYTNINEHTHTYTYMHTHIHMHTYIYIHIHTCIHLHTHWYTQGLYGFSSGERVGFSRAVGSKELFFLDDNKELGFNEILGAPLPRCPRDVSITAHWLAVEGTQPAIPQNPIVHSNGNIQEPHKRKRQQ